MYMLRGHVAIRGSSHLRWADRFACGIETIYQSPASIAVSIKRMRDVSNTPWATATLGSAFRCVRHLGTGEMIAHFILPGNSLAAHFGVLKMFLGENEVAGENVTSTYCRIGEREEMMGQGGKQVHLCIEDLESSVLQVPLPGGSAATVLARGQGVAIEGV
ncbi:hypothetical protein B0T21DRAFT_388852 [Apiosordaria backusii]|uniref:Uncharacterized protein n=1 Tax=Apiosordaria backusii TaxID=314023 RepID=A0AA40EYF7_9PEZI|nr:hypothetical protein B0T21DRAFT_388852 [Apiosordaria backusii]